VDHLVWVDSCTVDVGNVRAGIRTNSVPVAAALARALRLHVVDDPAAPRNFSVQFSRVADDAHLLFWGGCVAARSFDPDRILRALVDHLGAHREPPPGLVWVNALAYVAPAGAVLMPSRFSDDLRIVDRQLRAGGYVAVDSPRSLIDLASAELVVPDPLDVDDSALAEAAAVAGRRRAEPTVPPGRYPLDRWVFLDTAGRWATVSRATATRSAILEILEGIDRPDRELMEVVAELFTRVGARSMFPGYTMAMVDAVLDRPPPQ